MSHTRVVKVNPQKPEEKHLLAAADIIRDGGLVIVPTETVYGIAANSASAQAIERLIRIKNRPQDKHFSVHIDEKEKLFLLAKDIPTSAFKLADRFWPGPLTMILRSPANGTIGVRLPDSGITRRVIHLADVPVVCPSANISGRPAPVTVEDALADLDGKVDMALDAGRTRLGLESTVVDLTADPVRVLREGALKEQEVLAAARKKTVLFVCTGNSCRSVMAEAMLKKYLKERGRTDVEVISAGLMKSEGMNASYPTQVLLRAEGIDVSGHRSHHATPELLNRSDLILVMEEMHENEILLMAPWVKKRLFLLKEFARVSDTDLNIPDPIGGSEEFYTHTFTIIKEAVQRVAQLV